MPLLLTLTLCLYNAPADTEKPSAKVPPEDVRKVLTALVQAAEENAARGQDAVRGDALLELYVRRAASAARAAELSPRALLLALAVGLDHTDFVRSNPVFRRTLLQYESNEERQRRLKALGKPSLRGREDWALHFAISAGLTADLGPEEAERLGIAKELWDAHGRSGFSFADLAADYAGIALARLLLDSKDEAPRRLRELAEGFKGDDYLPRLDDLEDGLSWERFVDKYGGPKDERFVKHCEEVRGRVLRSPGLKAK